MEVYITVLLLSFAVTVLCALVLLPILKKLKIGQMVRDDGPQSHLAKQGTPTMGGIIMAAGAIILTIGCYFYFARNNLEIATKLFPFLFVTIGFGIVGFIDDYIKLVLKNSKGLKPSYKMIGLLIVAVAFTLYLTSVAKIGTDIYIPFWKTSITLPILIYIPFAVLVMLATTNAINLTDGIDGLSSSVTAIILTTLAIIGIGRNIEEVGIFGSIMVGACLAFLIFNLHPAKVFMGDTGSLLLGGIVAALALYLKMPLLLIVIALVPVLETISVMIQVAYFKKTGKRFFKMAPLHHHFELSGWKENKVVIVFSIVTLVLCVIGLKII